MAKNQFLYVKKDQRIEKPGLYFLKHFPYLLNRGNKDLSWTYPPSSYLKVFPVTFFHYCKLNRRQSLSLNLCNFTGTTLRPRIFSIFDFTHIYEKIQFIRLRFRNSNHFFPFQQLYDKKSYS